MTERSGAPRRRLGRLARRLAVVSAVATALAGAAGPALADAQPQATPSASSASSGTGVPGDLDGDGVADITIISSSLPGLRVASPAGVPYTASDAAQSPDGNQWNTYLVTHRGSLTGRSVDDLFALSTATGKLYEVPNDADFGAAPGRFTHPEHDTAIARPACAAPTDCGGYRADWTGTTQLIAIDGVRNTAGLPDLLTVQDGKLWYYPGTAGPLLGSPVLLGSGDWSGTTLIAPGRVSGRPALWARDDNTGGVVGYPLVFNADGTPAALLSAPQDTQIQAAVGGTGGTTRCLDGDAMVGYCAGPNRFGGWLRGADATLQNSGACLDATTAAQGTAATVQRQACDGRPSERWTIGATGSIANGASGLCLTAAYDGYSPHPTLETCTGAALQRWGGAVAADQSLTPLPAAQAVLPLNLYQNLSGVGYTAVSYGDVDADGLPDLFLVDTNLYLYPGAPAQGGLPAFGARIPLGESTSTQSSAGYLPADTVLYSRCARLTMQAQGDLVLTKLKTGQTLWSSGTAGHPNASAAVQGDGSLVIKDASGQQLWSTGTAGGQPANLALQDSCNLTLSTMQGMTWSTRTYDPDYDTTGHPLTAVTTLASGTSIAMATTHLDMQGDGNLVLYGTVTGRALWSSSTWGHPGASAVLQADGNLVVYDTDHNALWDSGTWGRPGAHLTLQNDRDLVLYDADGNVRWHTGTTFQDPAWRGVPVTAGTTLASGTSLSSPVVHLDMQADGNLVLYRTSTGRALWSSSTWGHPGASAVLQADGNLVVYDTDHNALWDSRTWTTRGAELVVQDDANAVIYDGDGRPVWSTGTYLQS
ncbi:hypothetical protein GCM10009665_24740 [Kitasatospora nipponensis]|uniref:Bulb-type lectin domain-containing protein n=1 Tax=Kitasatospora nipponensis TaxID=258049 RepID=A0ABP4GR72_9ACTN